MVIRSTIFTHALLPAMECGLVVLKFRTHEARSIDTWVTAITHAAPVTVTVDAAVGMLAKGRVPSSFCQEGVPQIWIICCEGRSRDRVNVIPCLGRVRPTVEASGEGITLASNAHYGTSYGRRYPRGARGTMRSGTRSSRGSGSGGSRLREAAIVGERRSMARCKAL